MSYPPEVNVALGILRTTKIWPSNYAPLLHRMLWRVGVSIPPPHLASFGFNFIFMGMWFGVFWGVTMQALVWSNGVSGFARVMAPAAGGLFVGLTMATYYRIRARKFNLPPWAEIKASI